MESSRSSESYMNQQHLKDLPWEDLTGNRASSSPKQEIELGCRECQAAEIWTKSKHESTIEPSLGEIPIGPAASHEQRYIASQKLYNRLHDWNFRVLKLQPRNFGSNKIIADLLVASMTEKLPHLDGVGIEATGENIEYEALSYCWGEPIFSASIICNGIDFPVTPGAYSALSNLRLPTRPRCIWIDAICINQLDNSEKSRQVEILMYRIYQRAKQVIGWLGYPSASMSRVLNLLVHLNLNEGAKGKGEHQDSVAHKDSVLALKDAAIQSSSILPKWPFFVRTWIRQEIFAAGDSMLLTCGHYQFRLSALMYLMEFSGNPQNDTFAQSYRCFQSLTAIRKMAKWGSASDYDHIWDRSMESIWIELLLQNGDGFQAGLDVDRVFALYNIASDLIRDPPAVPAVDYGLSYLDLWPTFLSALGQSRLGARFLEIFEEKEFHRSLPSYAPDLRLSKKRLLRETWGRSPAHFYVWSPNNSEPLAWPKDHPARKALLSSGIFSTFQSLPKQLYPIIVMGMKRAFLGCREKDSCDRTADTDLEFSGKGVSSFTLYGDSVDNDNGRAKPFTDVVPVLRSLSYETFDLQEIIVTKNSYGSKDKMQSLLSTVILAPGTAREGDLIVFSYIPSVFGFQQKYSVKLLQQPCMVIRPHSSGLEGVYTFVGPCTCWKRPQPLPKDRQPKCIFSDNVTDYGPQEPFILV